MTFIVSVKRSTVSVTVSVKENIDVKVNKNVKINVNAILKKHVYCNHFIINKNLGVWQDPKSASGGSR